MGWGGRLLRRSNEGLARSSSRWKVELPELHSQDDPILQPQFRLRFTLSLSSTFTGRPSILLLAGQHENDVYKMYPLWGRTRTLIWSIKSLPLVHNPVDSGAILYAVIVVKPVIPFGCPEFLQQQPNPRLFRIYTYVWPGTSELLGLLFTESCQWRMSGISIKYSLQSVGGRISGELCSREYCAPNSSFYTGWWSRFERDRTAEDIGRRPWIERVCVHLLHRWPSIPFECKNMARIGEL